MIIPTSYITVLNGVVTLLCGVYLLYRILTGPLKNLVFMLWTCGFFVYGVQIILRSYGFLGNLSFIVLVNLMTACFVYGMGLMIGHFLPFFVASSVLALISDYFMIGGYDVLSIAVSYVAFFIMMSLGMVILYFRYRENVAFITIGWILLTVSNIFAYSQVFIIVVDVFAIFAKVLLAIGLIKIENMLPESVTLKYYIDDLKKRTVK